MLLLPHLTAGRKLASSLTPPLRLLQAVVRLAFHPSEALIYTGCLDGVVRAWDVRTGEIRPRLLWVVERACSLSLLRYAQALACRRAPGTSAASRTWL